MREIKFRFWNYGTENMEECNFAGGVGYSNYFTRLDGAIMQFTGLKDKNGKEIREGDICKYGIGCWVGKVEFVKGAYLLDERKWLHEYQGSIEVIGNIYENPELLKGG